MRTNTLLSLFVAFAACTAFASPVEHKQEDVAHAVARSMMGSTNNIVSWESMQVERSPADPEVISEVEMEKRIVYNPPVTAPVSKQVWYAGREEVVKWKVDQDKIPAAANNFKVTIKLGYLPKNGEGVTISNGLWQKTLLSQMKKLKSLYPVILKLVMIISLLSWVIVVTVQRNSQSRLPKRRQMKPFLVILILKSNPRLNLVM
ncbi:hypothetical protein L7F22_027244 [Adiantum nelumboides]|nr:hypothetical protein [Adiantum nelumboides]